MANRYTNTVTKSYGNRLGQSFKNIILGLILFIASFVVLWINEGNSVRVQDGLNEGKKALVEIDEPVLDSSNKDRLVYVTGEATSSDIVSDEDFGVSSKGLMLKRKVEMYQWREDKESTSQESVGGSEETTTEYTYTKVWSDKEINSNHFFKKAEYRNPSEMPFKSKDIKDSEARLGDFALSDSIVSKIDREQEVDVSNLDISVFPGLKVEGKYLMLSGGSSYGATNNSLSLINPTGEETATTTNNSALPNIGDIRVSYTVVTEGPVSIVAKQTNNGLGAYTTENGTKLEMVASGDHSAEELFSAQENNNKITTWLVRVGGFIAMWVGLMLILGPISMLLAFIPVLKSITGFIAGLFTFFVALILTLLTIAVAWLFYRPLLSLLLIAAIAVALVLIKVLVINKVKNKPGSLPPSSGDDSRGGGTGKVNDIVQSSHVAPSSSPVAPATPVDPVAPVNDVSVGVVSSATSPQANGMSSSHASSSIDNKLNHAVNSVELSQSESSVIYTPAASPNLTSMPTASSQPVSTNPSVSDYSVLSEQAAEPQDNPGRVLDNKSVSDEASSTSSSQRAGIEVPQRDQPLSSGSESSESSRSIERRG